MPVSAGSVPDRATLGTSSREDPLLLFGESHTVGVWFSHHVAPFDRLEAGLEAVSKPI